MKTSGRRLLKLSIVASAIFATNAFAFGNIDSDSAFFKDAKVGLHLKAQYYDYEYERSKDFREVPYLGKFKFDSGYHDSWIGLDFHAGVRGMIKGFSDTVNGEYVGKNMDPDGSTYGDVSTLYLKTKFDFDDSVLRVGYGKKVRKTKLLCEKSNRIDKSKHFGLDLSYKTQSQEYFSSYITRLQLPNSKNFSNKMYAFNGEEIKYNFLAGVKSLGTDYSYYLEYQNIDEVIQRTYTSVGYQFNPIKTRVRLSWFSQFGAGDNFDGAAFPDQDRKGGYYGVVTDTKVNKLGLFTLAYYQNYGGDTFQFNGSPSSTSRVKLAYDFLPLGEGMSTLEDETSYTAVWKQNLSKFGLNGLFLWAQYSYGEGAKDFDGYKKTDFSVFVKQDLSKIHSKLNGWSISYLYEKLLTDGTNTRDGKRINDVFFHQDMTLNKLYVEYKF